MTRYLLRILFILTLLIRLTLNASANHIVGGELQMKRIGSSNTFEISLIQFWDTNNLIESTPTTGGNRDADAELYIYQKGNNSLLSRVTVNYISTATISYQNKACASVRSLNTSVGIYKGSITLNPQIYNDPRGYYMVWERCCRNDDINNIVQPGNAGMAFYLEFPPLTIPNSSPEFVAPNGQYICSNKPFTMNMSATDADGDELRYSLVTPLRGNTSAQQAVGNDSPKRGYPEIAWESGISLANIIPGSSPLSVSNAGILSVTANTLGLYVFTVQCDEYRNGQRIGTIRRDFQLLVIDCNDDQPEQPVIMLAAQPVKEVAFCPESPIMLETERSSAWSYQWQLNGLNLPGETGPTIMVKDSGNYCVVKSYTQKCSRDTSSIMVHVRHADPIQAIITADKDTLCKNETIILLANGGNTQSGETISWTKDGELISHTASSMQIKEAGMYVLQITNGTAGCAGKDTLRIGAETFTLSLPDRKGVLEGSKTTIIPSLTPANLAYTYAWVPTEGLDSDPGEKQAIVSPLQETTYTLIVTSPNGCLAEASVLVFVVDKMHIPNSFTPNNDGYNDSFQIYNAKDQILEMRVYSRWGELIFFSEGYDAPWDGTFKNEPVPAGIYPYVIKTADRDLNGTVHLIK